MACIHGGQNTSYGFQWGRADTRGNAKPTVAPVLKTTPLGRKSISLIQRRATVENSYEYAVQAEKLWGSPSNLMAYANPKQKITYYALSGVGWKVCHYLSIHFVKVYVAYFQVVALL